MNEAIALGKGALTLEDLLAVARSGARVTLAPRAVEAMEASLGWVDEILGDMQSGRRTSPI